ncbi:16S rRNA (cytosine(1402)-N(4))-methyltransferase RsmH [Spiroplasma alleghenense]|uniref:Ribosomal RNA small subunit methyltransferase H n=1 Tax=Spiroplasma alleghenense TaxID=216931 RepID=A0A345Z3W7_9MOLU|nr:16S rRNA (cytosine(1402)-N(4))-methyltransferase RsmH [Spiroplasma alleghenense]AXK51296.1 S-adenosyl-methyltransferase MraW [Spiroplasma alleghenense]
MTELHVPVLLKETLQILNIKESGVYVDATLGRAGHSQEILKRLTVGQLFGLDQDTTAIEYSQSVLKNVGKNFRILQGNFSEIATLLALNDVFKVDGILFDLGVSSPQFDNADRGFSYRLEGKLDMRMNQKSNELTAWKIVNEWSLKDLIQIFREYGEENYAVRIANRIIEARELKQINTTLELVDVIKTALPQKVLKEKKHPAKKVFQALRVCVNNEIEVLKMALKSSLKLLKKDGILAVITFQSLEEKVVKEVFKSVTIDEQDKFIAKLPIPMTSKKDFELAVKKPIKPSEEEIMINNRAHSAKLWAIKKI